MQPNTEISRNTYPTAAVDDASFLCVVQSHLLLSFGQTDVLLTSEGQVARNLDLDLRAKQRLDKK